MANEIKEYNKLSICMRESANAFGMACGCKKCMSEIIKSFNQD